MKDLQQDKESREKEWEFYEGQLADLCKGVNKTLDQTLKMVYVAFNQAVDQLEALHPGVLVLCSRLDPQKVVMEEP